jgi:hypothetical protein
MGNFADTSVILVAACLFRKTKTIDDQGRPKYTPVGSQELKTWPARHIARLFEKCKELGELNEKKPEGRSGKDAAAKEEEEQKSFDDGGVMEGRTYLTKEERDREGNVL